MEFMVLSSRFKRQIERERVVMQAVIEAAEAAGAEKIVVRRGDVYSTGVYVTDGRDNAIIYNDWEKTWNWKKIYEHIMAAIKTKPSSHHEYQIHLTA